MRSEFEATVITFFEDHGVSEDETKKFIDRVVRAAFGSVDEVNTKFSPPNRGKQADNAVDADVDADGLLCCVTDLLLMYGGSPEPLLRNTALTLVRGRRYGVIGSNGSGKTTLMARIAKKDIAGFPQDINVVHLRHEAILKGISPSTPAREYAKLRNIGDSAAFEEELARSLKEVGFTVRTC
uniref:Elongation factor 3-like n=1 Tax=Karlodinium veneficum TaxID=407301 RepID=E8Z729_KARVE|nr:elongation factor 3-like [Karlodinium veneficum]